MPQDRRSLTIGSCKGPEDTLSPQRVTGLVKGFTRAISNEETYGFAPIKTVDGSSSYFYNKLRSDIIASLEDVANVSDNTLLFVHFVGHSIPKGINDLDLFIGRRKNGEESYYSVGDLIEEIKRAGFKKIILSIDGCHSAYSLYPLKSSATDYFGMYSSEFYSFDGNFTESIIKTLEARIQKLDQRIERRAGGITLRRIFEASRANVREMINRGAEPQVPGSDGNLSDTVLLQTPPLLVGHYNDYASSRSIYGRIYKLISIIGKGPLDHQQLYLACQKSGGFLIRNSGTETPTFVSKERFADYTDFLIDAKMVVKPEGHYHLTDFGRSALNQQVFNKLLLETIESNIFPVGFDFHTLEKIITQLLDNLIPPTPSKIEDRLKLISAHNIKMTPKLRFALQILPSTGRFLKGSADALFLAEV